MIPRRSVRLALATVGLAGLVAAPRAARAQAVDVDVSGGIVTPLSSMYSRVRPGAQLGIGLSHRMRDTAVALGAELSVAKFGGNQLAYDQHPVGYMLVCRSPGCTFPAPVYGNLTLTNVFVTGRYRFATAGFLHPYVAAAVGIAQTSPVQQLGFETYSRAHQRGGSERVSAGVDARLGPLVAALDVAYARVAGVQYEGYPVRYVPVTLRLSF